MSTTDQSSEKAYQKHAWLILFVLGILLSLNILIVVIMAGPASFETDTGVAWDELSETYPTVATAFLLEQRLAYTGYLSLTLFALVITFFGFRKGHRWAWYAVWLLPITLAITVVSLMRFDQPDLAAYYGVYAVVAVIGLLLPYRTFFPKNQKNT